MVGGRERQRKRERERERERERRRDWPDWVTLALNLDLVNERREKEIRVRENKSV